MKRVKKSKITEFKIYTRLILYNLFIKPLLKNRPKYNKRYKMSICSIFKDEAPYLKEWIEFHHMIGVEHFYLYNNNSSDNYQEILSEYVNQGWITLVDWPDTDKQQLTAYRNFYETYRSESQWVMFMDADEFLVPKKDISLIDWIKDYENCPVILIFWKMFGTSNRIEHDFSKLVIEQYHISWQNLDEVGKCIWNTDYDIADFGLSIVHTIFVYFPIMWFKIVIPPLDVFKSFVYFKHNFAHNYREDEASIQLNHYWSKAWNSYVLKTKKTDIIYAKNPKSELWYFYHHENRNSTSNYVIYKYIIRLKLQMGFIEF